MKKFFLTVLFLILLAVGGLAFFVIRSFNTDTFQKQIINNITEMTGREFNVMGATYVTWFPTPQIVMNDISLANIKGEQRAVMLRANRIGVELEWASLLKNPLVIKKIDVENPTLFLERMDATHVNWNFPFLFKTPNEIDSFSDSDQLAQTRVDAVSIRGGTIEYTNNVNQTRATVNNINGNLSIETLQGPYTFNGTFKVKEKTMSAHLQVKELRNDAPVPFSLNLMGEDNNFTLDVNGTATPSIQKSLQLTANGSFSIKKPNDILKLFNLKPLSQQLNIPSSGNITYESANGVDAFKSFTIRFGNQENSVAVTGSLGREKSKKPTYTATIAINKLDYAQWTDFLSEMNGENLFDDKNPNFTLKLNAAEFIFDKCTAKNVVIDFQKNGEKFKILNGKASFAGDTNITFDGESMVQNKEKGISVTFVGKSNKFQEFLKQIESHRTGIQIPGQNVSFKGNTVIYPTHFSLDMQEMVLDKTKLSGAFNYQKTDKKPIIQTKLNIENINLDPYIFNNKDSENKKESKKATDISQLPSLIKETVNNIPLLQSFTGSFDLGLKNAIIGHLSIGNASISGSIENETLILKNIKATEVANAAIEGSATFNHIGTPKSEIVASQITFSSPQLNLFMDKARLTTTFDVLKKIKDINLKIELSEKENVWTTNLNTKTNDLIFKLNGLIDTRTEIPTYKDMQVSIEYPDFKKFSRNIYNPGGADINLNGQLLAQMTLNGTAKDISFSKGNIKIGPNQLTVSGNYKKGTPPQITLNIETPSFDINKFIWNDFRGIKWEGIPSQKPFNLNLFNSFDLAIQIKTPQLLYNNHELKNALLSGSIQGVEKTITLKELTGSLGDKKASLKASGSLNWQSEPTLNLEIDLKEFNLSDHLLTLKNMSYGEGLLSFSAQLTATGNSPALLLSHLNGKGNFELADNIWVGTSLEKISPLIKKTLTNRVPKNIFDKELNRLLNSGKTTIEKINAAFTIENGQFKALNTHLKGENFTSNPMSVQWNIPQDEYDISIPLTLTQHTDLPPFALNIKGKEKSLSYQTNFVDLSDSIADIVKQDNTRIAEIEQARKEEAQATARNEREEKIREAISEARTAVQQAGDKVNAGDNQKALYLLQSAQDALDFVNNMSIKETLTDAEYIQLMEQSRLTVLKAEEAVAEATNDKFFEDRKKLHAFEKSAREMQTEIRRIQLTYPDIEIVAKLSPITENYVQLLQKIAKESSADETDEDHQMRIRAARTAYTKVVKGYQYVLRFDAENTNPIQPISLSVPQNKAPQMFEKQKAESDISENATLNNQLPLPSEQTANETPLPDGSDSRTSEENTTDENDEKFEANDLISEEWAEPSAIDASTRIRNSISRSNTVESNYTTVKSSQDQSVNNSSFNTKEILEAIPSPQNKRIRGVIKRAK